MYIHPSPCSKWESSILAFHANSALSYGRASGAVVLGAALALLVAATPASRGGPVWCGSIGGTVAGVQLRLLNRSLWVSFFRQVLLLRAPFPVAVVSGSHARLPELVPIMLHIAFDMTSPGLPALAKGARDCFVVILDIATPFLPAVWSSRGQNAAVAPILCCRPQEHPGSTGSPITC